MNYVIMGVGIILGSLGTHQLFKGFKGGWLALTLMGATMWIMAMAYTLNSWGIK